MKVYVDEMDLVPFESIVIGECFMWCDNHYMRTELIECINDAGDSYRINAVNLVSGTFRHFENSDGVQRRDAEVKVKVKMKR